MTPRTEEGAEQLCTKHCVTSNVHQFCLISLSQNWKCCHCLLTLNLLQSHMNLLLLRYTKRRNSEKVLVAFFMQLQLKQGFFTSWTKRCKSTIKSGPNNLYSLYIFTIMSFLKSYDRFVWEADWNLIRYLLIGVKHSKHSKYEVKIFSKQQLSHLFSHKGITCL